MLHGCCRTGHWRSCCSRTGTIQWNPASVSCSNFSWPPLKMFWKVELSLRSYITLHVSSRFTYPPIHWITAPGWTLPGWRPHWSPGYNSNCRSAGCCCSQINQRTFEFEESYFPSLYFMDLLLLCIRLCPVVPSNLPFLSTASAGTSTGKKEPGNKHNFR